MCLLFNIFYNAFAIPAFTSKPLNEVGGKNQTDIDGDTLLKEMKELEKQKGDLYKEINKAMEESITALKKSNDTDADVGINYIQDLKKLIRELNNTEDTADVIYNEYRKRENKTLLDTSNNKGTFLDKITSGFSVDTRRKHDKKDKYLIDTEKELHKVLYENLPKKKLKQRLEAREKIRLQLEEWIAVKDREKAKIKAYKDLFKKKLKSKEMCPKWGFSHMKKKSKKGDFPCCRKCCKKSYLGCLKK